MRRGVSIRRLRRYVIAALGGSANTMEEFTNLQEAQPGALRTLQESLRLPGLKVVNSTE